MSMTDLPAHTSAFRSCALELVATSPWYFMDIILLDGFFVYHSYVALIHGTVATHPLMTPKPHLCVKLTQRRWCFDDFPAEMLRQASQALQATGLGEAVAECVLTAVLDTRQPATNLIKQKHVSNQNSKIRIRCNYMQLEQKMMMRRPVSFQQGDDWHSQSTIQVWGSSPNLTNIHTCLHIQIYKYTYIINITLKCDDLCNSFDHQPSWHHGFPADDNSWCFLGSWGVAAKNQWHGRWSRRWELVAEPASPADQSPWAPKWEIWRATDLLLSILPGSTIWFLCYSILFHCFLSFSFLFFFIYLYIYFVLAIDISAISPYIFPIYCSFWFLWM